VKRSKYPVLVVALLLATLIPNICVVGDATSATPQVPRCTYAQLQVATTWGTGDLAGHYGVPFLIVNVGHTSCYLEGYATLRFDAPVKHHITVDHVSGAYATVKPRRVVITPGGIATFGLTIGEASNQGDTHIAACTVSDVYTALPVAGFNENYENNLEFNICFADYQVGITAIEPGPLPNPA
jgi:hypothetical protein